MKIKTTKIFDRIINALSEGKYRYFALQGGTSSSKTWTILQVLIFIALTTKRKLLISIVSETVPHLKKGVIKDFFNIMQTSQEDKAWNATDRFYRFKNGTVIEFFSVDKWEKAKGSRRDILYINECNHVNYNIVNQLQIRTKDYVFFDWNPETRFWFHKQGFLQKENVFFDKSTHWDNPYLDISIRKEIEQMKEIDPDWYRVYGLGEIGVYKGRVFKNIEVRDIKKEECLGMPVYYGLDFGWFPDPFAFVKIMYDKNNKIVYIVDEICANDVDNEGIYKLIKDKIDKNVLFCDSAEPKSIRELNSYGVKAIGAVKKDRDYSIRWLKAHKIVINKKCKTAINEFEEYEYKKDKNNEYLPIFPDGKDHTIDATRYALSSVIFNTEIKTFNVKGF